MKEADAKEIRIEGKFELFFVIEYLWWIDETGKLCFLFPNMIEENDWRET